MYKKFIITGEGVLRFGVVYQHCELLKWGEECLYGGGLWVVDERRGAVLLYGRSFAFGAPCVEMVQSVDWDSLGLEPCPLFFVPQWPKEDSLLPITAY